LPRLRRRAPTKIREPIAVHGFPLPSVLASSGNVTAGSISALAGIADDPAVIQISAPVQPGNSGGPVLDSAGNVIGVVVAKLDALKAAKITQDIPQNVNFAIKASVAINFLDAHAVPYTMGTPSGELPPAEVAARAEGFTVQIMCYRALDARN
jgi:S1-C subfamily serine protease